MATAQHLHRALGLPRSVENTNNGVHETIPFQAGVGATQTLRQQTPACLALVHQVSLGDYGVVWVFPLDGRPQPSIACRTGTTVLIGTQQQCGRMRVQRIRSKPTYTAGAAHVGAV